MAFRESSQPAGPDLELWRMLADRFHDVAPSVLIAFSWGPETNANISAAIDQRLRNDADCLVIAQAGFFGGIDLRDPQPQVGPMALEAEHDPHHYVTTGEFTRTAASVASSCAAREVVALAARPQKRAIERAMPRSMADRYRFGDVDWTWEKNGAHWQTRSPLLYHPASLLKPAILKIAPHEKLSNMAPQSTRLHWGFDLAASPHSPTAEADGRAR